MTTYGQLKENNGNKITLAEFEKEVAKRLKDYILLKFTSKDAKLCRSLYKKGYTISDTCSFLILNA